MNFKSVLALVSNGFEHLLCNCTCVTIPRILSLLSEQSKTRSIGAESSVPQGCQLSLYKQLIQQVAVAGTDVPTQGAVLYITNH